MLIALLVIVMNVDAFSKVKWIYVASFIDLFAVSLILPSMSSHFKSLGASHFVIGGISAIYACSQLLSGPIIGSWSDNNGRQITFITIYCIISICYLILAFTNSLCMILFVRAIIGTFKHGQALLHTIVRDQIPAKYQSKIIGHLKSVAGVSFTLGPAIGGHLAEFDNGFSYLYWCTGTLMAMNIVIGYLYLADGMNQEVSLRHDAFKENIMEAVRNLSNLKWHSVGHILASKFVLDIAVGLFYFNYNLKIQNRFNISPKLCGYTVALQSFISVMSGLSIDYLNDKFYRTDIHYGRRITHGFLFISIAFLATNFTNHLIVFLIWSIILTSNRLFLRVILTDMLMKQCPPSHIGSITGSVTSVSNLARLIIPFTAGTVENFWGTNSTDVLAAIIASIGIGFSLMIGRHQHERSPNTLSRIKYN